MADDTIITADAADYIAGSFHWVTWPDGVTEIAIVALDARGRRVWRNTRRQDQARVFAVHGPSLQRPD